MMKIKNLARGLASAIVLLSSLAQATPLRLQMEGEWFTQYEYKGLGANVVPISIPVTFSATIVFDPALAATWGTGGGNPPKQYVTSYGAPTIASSVIEDSFQNPFGISGPGSSFTILSRSDYSTDRSPPAPFENYEFANRNYTSRYLTDATMAYWSYGFEFYSGNSNISSGDIHFVNGDTFSDMLFNALTTRREFYTSFTSYTFEIASPFQPPVTYTGGIGLNGSARIVSISIAEPITEIPEPGSLALLGLALSGLAVTRRLRRPS